ARPVDVEGDSYGFPKRFQVAISDDPKFEKSEMIADNTLVDFPDPGAEVVKVPANGQTARYVRVTAPLLFKRANDAYLFALAEVEAISGGKNVGLGATVTSLDSQKSSSWSEKYLTDGFDGRRWLSPPADKEARETAEKKVAQYA